MPLPPPCSNPTSQGHLRHSYAPEREKPSGGRAEAHRVSHKQRSSRQHVLSSSSSSSSSLIQLSTCLGLASNHTCRAKITLAIQQRAGMASDPAGGGGGAGRRRRVVVAVDEGDESMHALSWCLSSVVSAAPGDTLVLLHARRPRPVYAAMDSSGYMLASDVMANMERHASAVSTAVVDKAKSLCAEYPHVKVETMVESGDPRDVIYDATDKLGADLLVMGSHGYGVIQRAFLGSVSNYCAQNCKCPVLIVKKPKE